MSLFWKTKGILVLPSTTLWEDAKDTFWDVHSDRQKTQVHHTKGSSDSVLRKQCTA